MSYKRKIQIPVVAYEQMKTTKATKEIGIGGHINNTCSMLVSIEYGLDILRGNLIGAGDENLKGTADIGDATRNLLTITTDMEGTANRCDVKIREVMQSLGYGFKE